MESYRDIISRDGVSLAYRIHRSGQSRRVLALLRGLASNMTRWSEFLAHTRLTQTWDILRFDLRGHGCSSYRGTIGMEVWCQDIAQVFDHEAYERTVVIGHSMGALVAHHARYTQRSTPCSR